MRRFFGELYLGHLSKTLFFIAMGVSSSVGYYAIIKHFVDNDFYATIASAFWATVLVIIYSDTIAKRDYQYRLLADSFNYHRTLRADNRIGAVVPEVPKVEEPKVELVVEEEKPNKPEFSKIEIVHSMEPMVKTKEANI